MDHPPQPIEIEASSRPRPTRPGLPRRRFTTAVCTSNLLLEENVRIWRPTEVPRSHVEVVRMP